MIPIQEATMDVRKNNILWVLMVMVIVQCVVIFHLWNRSQTNLQLIMKHDSQIRAINSLDRIEELLLDQTRLIKESIEKQEVSDDGTRRVQGSH